MKRLPIKIKKELLFFDFNEIIFIERIQKKTIIRTKKQDIEVTEPLFSIYNRLDKQTFIRTHKSYIVNVNYIKKISQWSPKTYKIVFNGSNSDALFSYERYKEFTKKHLFN